MIVPRWSNYTTLELIKLNTSMYLNYGELVILSKHHCIGTSIISVLLAENYTIYYKNDWIENNYPISLKRLLL